MKSRKNQLAVLALVLAAGLIAAAVAAGLSSLFFARAAFDRVDAVCRALIAREPDAREILPAALKACAQGSPGGPPGEGVLSSLGYRASDFLSGSCARVAVFAAAALAAGLSLFLLAFLCQSRAQGRRIRALAEYLERANSGEAAVLSASGEDEFSKLEDEIYKTVTALYLAKEQAVQAKNGFAENLSNIAHQIKTPITAASLAVQRTTCDCHALWQVEKQLSRLTYLEESLLLLARLDAGALLLKPEKTDAFTLLVLAADNLQELFSGAGVSVEIPERGETPVWVDREWTMEAVMNLMKNGLEHSAGGTLRCALAQNPLYTQILIEDDGEGFAKEDLPHLFERFYRGRNAREGSVGIGLALAKEIVERQNGTIRAQNRPGGGAQFEIRFYRH